MREVKIWKEFVMRITREDKQIDIPNWTIVVGGITS